MVVIGSDSHTCPSGALGCLAIGLDAADVTLPLITGETWFKVPECINIRLVGAPQPGIGGKDIILYILQQLKRTPVVSRGLLDKSNIDRSGKAHASKVSCEYERQQKQWNALSCVYTSSVSRSC
jgi:aconitase B